jgi:uncharacterized membrane protein YbhN (UPF0104 family)
MVEWNAPLRNELSLPVGGRAWGCRSDSGAGRKSMKLKNYIWPVIGFAAVGFSAWLLYGELRYTSLDDVWAGLMAIKPHQWVLAGFSAIVAYAALAGYDHIALLHLRRRVPWLFVTICSFTTYALSHNIGGSVLSGAVVRYRAYASRGLSGQDVGVLVGLCSLTFALGVIFLTGIVMVIHPNLLERFADLPPLPLSHGLGVVLLLLVAAYVFGSWLHLKPLKIGKFELVYPRLPIVARQLIIGPLEIMAAAAIIYFALPGVENPGYLTVLGVFLVSFSLALLSHAPGGLGVLEIAFLAGLSDMDPASVMAALLVFRLFYLIIPLFLAIFVVLGFERTQLARG